jgi:hypothetical protein
MVYLLSPVINLFFSPCLGKEKCIKGYFRVSYAIEHGIYLLPLFFNLSFSPRLGKVKAFWVTLQLLNYAIEHGFLFSPWFLICPFP